MHTCFICGGIQEQFLKWKDLREGTTKKEFKIIKCKDCKLEEIYPLPNEKEISSFYPSNYYSYNEVEKKSNFITLGEWVFSSLEKLWGVRPKEFIITNYENWEGKSFLEIWCGSWKILRNMDKMWWKTEWFELWEKKKVKNIFYGSSIVDTNFEKKYDLIYISHTFEHIANPIEFLNKIHNLLNDAGKCIITCPNIDCISANIYKQYAEERDIPRHLFNYNFNNLEKLLKKQWFKIIKKRKLYQYWRLIPLLLLIKDKYWLDLRGNKIVLVLKSLISIFTDSFLNIIKNTNQMWFIVSKKN